MGHENIKFVNTEDGLKVYVKPIIRTLLNDLASFSNMKSGETLGRRIKDRMDSNCRLLVKKGLAKSLIQVIHGQQFILVNCDIRKVNENCYRIMNNF